MKKDAHAGKDLPDEKMIERIREGEDSFTELLMNKYKDLVRKKAGSLYILGADKEDLIQEGMIGLFKAIRDFNCERDASFATFADLCVSRQMYSAIESAERKKNVPLNHYVSLDAEFGGEESSPDGLTGEPFINSLIAEGQRTPEEHVIDQEAYLRLSSLIETELTALEREVLRLNLTGMPTAQIAKVLGREEKSTDNALQRAKGKLKKKLSDTKPFS